MRLLWTCNLDSIRAKAYRLWTAIPPRSWDLVIEIAIALVTGLYAGAIVARMARFSALKNEALRLARAIDTIPEERALTQIQQANIQFALISSDLYYLGHTLAGNVLSKLSHEFDDVIGSRRIPADFVEYYEKWQVMIRTMPPSRWSIFRPWIDISKL